MNTECIVYRLYASPAEAVMNDCRFQQLGLYRP